MFRTIWLGPIPLVAGCCPLLTAQETDVAIGAEAAKRYLSGAVSFDSETARDAFYRLRGNERLPGGIVMAQGCSRCGSQDFWSACRYGAVRCARCRRFHVWSPRLVDVSGRSCQHVAKAGHALGNGPSRAAVRVGHG